MKILTLDLELAPTIATVWNIWNQNIGINQIIGNSYVLSCAAKWYGEDEVFLVSQYESTNRQMLKKIYDLINKADVVVGYNLDSFDMKILHKEFALQGWGPPAPYKTIDLLKVVKKRFRFTSNKLDYVAQMFKLGKKTKHPGHEMWLSCMNKKASDYDEAWEKMLEYNVQDVILTEALYERIMGWIPNAPSYSAFYNDHVCPTCGGEHLQRRGKYATATMVYQRWRCKDCFAWSRSRLADKVDSSQQVVPIK